MHKLFAVLLTVMALTACGFQLRGQHLLPPELKAMAVVTSNPYGEFEMTLKRDLEASGVHLTDDIAQAPYRLELISVKQNRRILTVSPKVKVSEYEIEQTVEFRLLDKDGKERIPKRTLHARRDYTFNPDLVLGKTEEESMLWTDIYRDLSRQLLQTLSMGYAR